MTKKITILLSLLIFLTVSATAQNQLKGEWQLVSMADENGAEVSLPAKFNIKTNFESLALRINSCNHISGKYSAGKKTIKITLTRTTAMYCPGFEKEQTFTKLLKITTTYSIKNNELTLSGKNNKPTLKFKRKTNEKRVGLNGKWQLVSMTLGINLPFQLPVKPITLNIEKDKIGGNGGCNAFGGSFSQKGKTVKFSDIFSTKMWCEDSSPTENKYFNALGKSVNFELEDDELILTDAKKENTLIFKPN